MGLKDATGDDEYARELRRRCPDLDIVSGDDARTLGMMQDPAIRAGGVISVMSNLVPSAVASMVRSALAGDWGAAERRATSLAPLFDAVTLRANESGPAANRSWCGVAIPFP